jgi:ABC-type nitrate/sulfonate/bicarbonate transport system substrate-binding protein
LKKSLLLALVLIISISFLSSCATKTSSKDKITFILDWTPNTNHTGLYVAIDNGYFAEQNITVDVIQPGDNSSDTIVASGKADYGF